MNKNDAAWTKRIFTETCDDLGLCCWDEFLAEAQERSAEYVDGFEQATGSTWDGGALDINLLRTLWAA